MKAGHASFMKWDFTTREGLSKFTPGEALTASI